MPIQGTKGAHLLSHIRVVDLSMGWSGPLAARHLADMGAEVVKVEAIQHLDWWRGWDLTPEMIESKMYEQSSSFNVMNRNKLGVTLDIASPEGADLVKRLVRISDVVIENHTASVLPKLGLDYPRLSEVNPGIIMISLPAFGCTGSWRAYRAYGSTVEQASGIPHLTGEPQWPPTMQHVAYGDSVAGINASSALLIALWHRQETGEGQYIDLSQVECLFPLEAHGIIEQSMNNRAPKRHGNRHPKHVPYGVFPCLGDDNWVVITITDDEEWQSLCKAMGRPDLAEDTELMKEAKRKGREKELESFISGWTSKMEPDEVTYLLQGAGVPAARVWASSELLENPQFIERDFFEWIDRENVGVQPHPKAPYRVSTGLRGVETPAPCLGEHNEKVLGELLGLTKDELAELEAKGVIGRVPVASSAGDSDNTEEIKKKP
ncbi:MAG: CoA transferase [Deltaproteobacteria bacterium]|nr:CoA transferase [Deltaproteobacteria bacterium]